jgi:NodT family efflux transporter outer membrane factor (OMF) lipoprotein
MHGHQPSSARRLTIGLLLASVALSGCLVGPNYKRPPVETPPAFKEAEGWTPAKPADDIDKGAWWGVFNDPVLDALERKVEVSNQNLAAAEAAYRAAHAIVAEDRAQLFPTVGLTGSANASGNGGGSGTTITGTGVGGSSTTSQIRSGSNSRSFQVGGDASWAPDLWGKIRRTIEGAHATAQASAADVANARLTAQATLATTYFSLRMTDADKMLFQDTVNAYERALTVTQNKYKVGVAARSDVLTAQTQLINAKASLVDFDRQRTQDEHAIAVLTGQPPADLTITPIANWTPGPPTTPTLVPSTILQRRPDVAAAERAAKAANAQVGIAVAAYFPTLSLTGSGGVESSAVQTLFRASSTFWSVGADVSETILDFGARHAAVQQAKAQYDEAVAQYRQTVLTAFQNVEDALAAARVLQDEQTLRAEAAASAVQNVEIVTNEYKAGTVDYTTVATAQATALSARQALSDIQATRMTEAVDLIQALGGGWSADELKGK